MREEVVKDISRQTENVAITERMFQKLFKGAECDKN